MSAKHLSPAACPTVPSPSSKPPNSSATFDGYLRLSVPALRALSFRHLFSDVDPDLLGELKRLGIATACAGCSEWVATERRSVSLGWSWYVDAKTGQMLIAPEDVRSNLMLTDAGGYDLGPARSASCLRSLLPLLDWKTEVAAALADVLPVKYSSFHSVNAAL